MTMSSTRRLSPFCVDVFLSGSMFGRDTTASRSWSAGSTSLKPTSLRINWWQRPSASVGGTALLIISNERQAGSRSFLKKAAPTPLSAIPFERELSFHRRNDYYRPAMTWGTLLLHKKGFKSLYARGDRNTFAFLLDMNLLFEEFVAVVLNSVLEGLPVTVHSQKRNHSILFNEKTGHSFASIRPDFLVRRHDSHGARWLPVDAKYKLYGERRISMSDVYQTFFYAQAYATGEWVPAAFILYPTEETPSEARLFVRGDGSKPKARIVGIGLAMSRVLAELRGDDSSQEIDSLGKLVWAGLNEKVSPISAKGDDHEETGHRPYE